MKPLDYGKNTKQGWRFTGRVYIRDILRDREPTPTPSGCAEVLGVLRSHGHPMSFTLIRSRTMMPAFLLASCLAELIEVEGQVSYDDWDLFEAG